MTRVFVVQIPKVGGRPLDISDAYRFGDVIEPIFNTQPDVDTHIDEVVQVIVDFFEAAEFKDGDYILQVGEHTLFTTACMIATTFVDSVKILKWNRRIVDGKRNGGGYTPIEIPVYCDG